MTFDLHYLLGIVLLTAGYWLVDRGIRHNQLTQWVETSFPSQALPSNVLPLVGAGVLSFFWDWGDVSEAEPIRVLALLVSGLLTWKATTKDIDVVTGEAQTESRVALVFATVGIWASPAFLIPTAMTLSGSFGMWQHHATFPMRVLQAVLAWLLLTLLPLGNVFYSSSVLWWFLVVLQASHYFITALAKIWLGPKWNSWVTDNQVHHLAASAYSWGWARFIPWEKWLRVIRGTQRVEKPIQGIAFGLELLAPLALLSPSIAMAMGVAWSLFHVGVFALSGLLFWDWIGTNLALALALSLCPSHVTEPLFGMVGLGVGIVFLALFPLRHKLWKPMPLGWWDTPLTQRIHWHVQGESGKTYALTNAFMCPHERLFGKVNACFFAPKPVFTYHLGEVWKHELRDAIREAGSNPYLLDKVRDTYGILPRDVALARNHVAYLKRFFHQLNQGAKKQILPPDLRWLKAPGGQVFYWNELPVFSGQEKVQKVTLHYREEVFDGEKLDRIYEAQVLEIFIDETAAEVAPVRAPTPKEIDDFLLSYANGKLIDLPSFGDGFVRSDDGKPES